MYLFLLKQKQVFWKVLTESQKEQEAESHAVETKEREVKGGAGNQAVVNTAQATAGEQPVRVTGAASGTHATTGTAASGCCLPSPCHHYLEMSAKHTSV